MLSVGTHGGQALRAAEPARSAPRKTASQAATGAAPGGSAPGRGRRGARAAPPGDVTTRRVLVAAGGTAGHVMPALAVAEELVRAGAEVTFAGTPERAEAQLVPAARLRRSTPSASQGLPRKPSLALACGRSRWTSRRPLACSRILRRRRPHAVLGGGGFVAGPDARWPPARSASRAC